MDREAFKPAMKRRRHGLASLFLVAGAMTTALVSVWRQSAAWGWAYLLLLAAGSAAILFAYCAKCPCRSNGCGHVIPGLLTRALPARNRGAYTIPDYLGVALPLALCIAIPQPWMWPYPMATMLFWLLLAAGGIDILMHVCKDCGNHRCPLRSLRN